MEGGRRLKEVLMETKWLTVIEAAQYLTEDG
jgi:hypothetical protein